MELFVYGSIGDIPRDEWDGWFGSDYPFLGYDFLLGLETADCTTVKSGWAPFHLVLREGDVAIGAAPGFLKEHSYGSTSLTGLGQTLGIGRGLSTIRSWLPLRLLPRPTGPRLWADPNRPNALGEFSNAVTALCEEKGITGWHILFADDYPALEELPGGDFVERVTCQFHWINRGYRDFEDFLQTFSSRKRKNLRKERASIVQQGLCLYTFRGSAITSAHWQLFHHCYQTTYAKRSGHGGYLTKAFFLEVCPTLGDIPVMVIAEDEGGLPVAAALYFESSHTLYGRYWGVCGNTTTSISKPAITGVLSTAFRGDYSALTRELKVNIKFNEDSNRR